MDLARARDGHDVVAPMQEPGEGELPGAAAFLLRDALERFEEAEIAPQRLAPPARHAAPEIIRSQIFSRAGQKAAAERAIGHEADAERAADGQRALLGIAR